MPTLGSNDTRLNLAQPMLAPEEIQLLDGQFNSQPTEEFLRWAWQRFGARAAIGTSFQGAGLVMMHLAKESGLPFPVFTLDTGLLFEETIQLKQRLEDFSIQNRSAQARI
jgi:phosphoadenosine phosphosulfate reductase